MESRVLLIDDHPVVQLGIKSFIERNNLFKHTDLASTGKEAVGLIKANKSNPEYYQLAIVDINLPDYEALALVRFIMDHCPKTPILMFSMEPPKLYLKRLLNLGVKGYISKTSPDDELLFAIKSILAGKTYFASDIMMEIMTAEDEDDPFTEVTSDLSSRESEILSLLIRGKSSKEICELLNLHKSSVATYRTRVFEKIGVKSNFELYQWALKEGLIHP